MRPIAIIPFLLAGPAFAAHLTADEKIDLHHPNSSYHSPVAVADACELDVPCDVLANDTDEDGNALTLVSVSNGTIAGGLATFTTAGPQTYVMSDQSGPASPTATGAVTVNGAPPEIVHEWLNQTPGFNAGHVAWPLNYTVTMVVNANSYSDYARMGSQAEGPLDPDHDFMVSASVGSVRARVCTDGLTEVMIGGSLVTGQEQRFDVTYDGSIAVLYVDGLAAASFAKTGIPCSNANRDFMIGAQPPGGTDVFVGTIPRVTIRDVAWTAQQVADDAGAVIPPPPPPPPPPTGSYVDPANAHVTFSTGVVAAIPTATYTGPMTITLDNTTIENSIVNGCLDIRANNFTLRNSIVNCGGLYALHMIGGTNALIEYNEINMTTDGKVFNVNNYADLTVSRNDIHGGEDFAFIGGAVGDMVVSDNWMHDVVGDPGSHADGFQIGEAQATTGTLSIYRNHISFDTPGVGITGILFSTSQAAMAIDMQDNWLAGKSGQTVLRCNDKGATSVCEIRDNIWELAGQFPNAQFYAGGGVLSCNRYDDGTLIPNSAIAGPPNNCP